MARGEYVKLTPEAMDAVWLRLRAGQAAKPTARQLGLSTRTVRDYLLRCGGIRPDPRRRWQQAVDAWPSGRRSPADWRRACRCGQSRQLGRAPSTVSREVTVNGGRPRYRALADRAAWSRATRPKACEAGRDPGLRAIVEEKLQRRWSPQQIAGWLKLTLPRPPGDAGVAREHLPHPVRAVARRAAQGADRVPAHRPGHPPPQGRPPARRSRRPAEHPAHLRAASRGRGPGGARTLGRRPGLRQGA